MHNWFTWRSCCAVIHFFITDKKPPKDWPAKGSVVFDRLFLSYSKSLSPVLRNVTFSIKTTEKVRKQCYMVTPFSAGLWTLHSGIEFFTLLTEDCGQVALVLHVWQIPGQVSNQKPVTVTLDVRDCSWSSQVNTRRIHQIGPHLLPFTAFHFIKH
jgi:hypothetical protein